MVLVTLLVRRSPVKHERDVPLVQQIEGDDLALELAGSGQVVAGSVRVLVPQRADVDQRARVNVDRAAADEAKFLKANTGRGLDVAPRKLLKQSIDAHCSRGDGSAAAAAEESRVVQQRVRQRGQDKVARFVRSSSTSQVIASARLGYPYLIPHKWDICQLWVLGHCYPFPGLFTT